MNLVVLVFNPADKSNPLPTMTVTERVLPKPTPNNCKPYLSVNYNAPTGQAQDATKKWEPAAINRFNKPAFCSKIARSHNSQITEHSSV